MKTTSLADVSTQLSKYVDDVMTTHERVTITKNGKDPAVLISVEDLEALEETLYWQIRTASTSRDTLSASTS
jgi:antitoxin YefM